MKQEEKTKLTRERIIHAGIKEFGSKGYAAASINSISESGIAKGLLYHNFKGKDELYIECLKVCFEEVTGALSCNKKEPDYKLYFHARMQLLKEKREMMAMVLEALIHPPQRHVDEISKIRMPYDEMNMEWLEHLLEDNQLRSGMDKSSAMEYLSVMQDMFNWYCCNPKFKNKSFQASINLHEENLYRIFEYMLYGILKEK